VVGDPTLSTTITSFKGLIIDLQRGGTGFFVDMVKESTTEGSVEVPKEVDKVLGLYV